MKVGGYILGEFGNLIAGDQRSAPSVQFQLLHSKVNLLTVTGVSIYNGYVLSSETSPVTDLECHELKKYKKQHIAQSLLYHQ